MNEQALFTRFWIDEAETTHKVLSRIPEGSDYRPQRPASPMAWSYRPGADEP